MKSLFYEYVDGVIDEKIVVGELMRKAVQRFITDVDKKNFVFDYKEGMRIVDFAEKFCCHWKGPKSQGKFKGSNIVLEPHQHFYWIQKYGWKNPETGLPRFRRSVKMIARKQYKTTEAAIEALFHMIKGIDVPAQVFTCATKEDDAVIVVNDAGRIAMSSPKLEKIFKVSIHEPYVRRVFCDNGSFMTYMTKGHDAVDISMGIGDECHDWPDASIKNRIESAMGNRMAPMFSTITTAGHDKDGYCFGTLRDTSIKILNGVLEDDEQLILIFELDKDDDWKNHDVWVKSCPNLQYSLTHKKYLESEFKKALNEGGTTEANFKTKNLNLWVDAPDIFIPAEVWDRNTHGFNEEDLIGQECYGGFELVGAKGMSAFCLIFPGEVTKLKMFFWMPGDYLKNNTDRFDKTEWQEFLKIDSGNTVENNFVIEWLTDEIAKYNMHSFAFPKMKDNDDIVQGLIRMGLTGNPISQAVGGIGNPTSQWEDLLHASKLEHFNNPVLRWMNSNCNVIRKEAGFRIEKQGSRVVGISAGINALAQWKTIEAEGKMTEFSFESL